MEMLWHQIDEASRLSSARRRTLIFVGDYIDRGMHSAELIDRLLEGFPGFETIYLKGNHDETLLQFLTDPTVGDVWRNFGGLETLRSYGVSHGPAKTWSQTRSEFAAAIPKSHVDFFKNLKLHVTIGDYLFVHAGLKPRVPLEDQRESDLLWIREEFFSQPHALPYTVVFGHTPPREARIDLPYRIGLDTGLVYGNKLSCLDAHGQRLVQVARGARRATVHDLTPAFAAAHL